MVCILTNKLVIIGNGFDLHLHVKSSFQDFLKSDVLKDTVSLSKFEDIESYYLDFIRLSNLSPNKQESYKEKIELYISKVLFPEYFEIGINDRILPNQKNNFWSYYFTYLSKCPDKNNGFISKKIRLRNWKDVEYQIQYFLEKTESTFNYINKMKNRDKITVSDAGDRLTAELFNVLKSDDTIKFSDLIHFNALFISLRTGWDSSNQDIYKFLFEELIEFENIFKNYLQKEVDAKKDYNNIANNLLMEIAETDNFNLINFNYTTFYDLHDKNKINIHSTLSENSHPIFGISPVGINGENNYDKPFYAFTKTYRIMSITDVNSDKNIFPDDIEEIIFYGHSLSTSDYMYFETILRKYLDKKNKKVKFNFKYSKYSNEAEQEQVKSIFNLFNIFYSTNRTNNDFQKLLLENMIKIQEL